MGLNETLRTEVTNHLILSDQLKASYAEIDDETLADTLEGISNLPEAIEAIVRSSLDDDAFIAGLKGRLEDLQIRLERLKDRYEKKRALARWAMLEADLEKIVAADFSVGLRKGVEKLEVLDEALVPKDYFMPQPPKLDRKGVADALKRGVDVAGASLVTGEPSISVRVR